MAFLLVMIQSTTHRGFSPLVRNLQAMRKVQKPATQNEEVEKEAHLGESEGGIAVEAEAGDGGSEGGAEEGQAGASGGGIVVACGGSRD